MILHYSKRSLFWSLIIFAYLSFTTFREQIIGFNHCECIKFLNIANIHALDVWGKRIFICNNKLFFLCFFSDYTFTNATLFHSVTSSNLRNQAPLFKELRLLQGTNCLKSNVLRIKHWLDIDQRSNLSLMCQGLLFMILESFFCYEWRYCVWESVHCFTGELIVIGMNVKFGC